MHLSIRLPPDRHKQILQRTLLIGAALLIAPLAPIVHADYDFNNPAYAVHNPSDTPTAPAVEASSQDSGSTTNTGSSREQDARDSYEQRQAEYAERNRRQAELSNIQANQMIERSRQNPNPITFTQHRVLIDKDGKTIDYDEFMKSHPDAVDHGDFVTIRHYGYAGQGFGITFLIFVLFSGGGFLINKYKEWRDSRLYVDEPNREASAVARGNQLAAAMAGKDVPIAMRKVAAPSEPAPQAADQPIEFVRTVIGAPVEVAPPVAPKPVVLSGTTLWAQTQLDLFAAEQSPEPILYASQVKKIGLDYSAESLGRIDQFLQQLRLKTSPALEEFNTRIGHRNLLILLGLYIGTTVSRITGQPIKWYDYAGAKTLLDRKGYSESIQCAYSCMLGRTDHYMPIELVCDILFAETPSLSCVASLAHHQQRAGV